jgi:hypothetical protein
MDSKRFRAAVVLVQALKRRNGQTKVELADVLESNGIEPGPRFVSAGVRMIRDVYGANGLVCTGQSRGRAPIYTLDPSVQQAHAWSRQMIRRGLTEAQHVQQVLDWTAKTHGNKGPIRRARHYQKNVIVELEAVLEGLDANGS